MTAGLDCKGVSIESDPYATGYMYIMIPFLLNCRPMTSELPAGLPVLDLLRRELGLSATKTGCREGDCGACSVLPGALPLTAVCATAW